MTDASYVNALKQDGQGVVEYYQVSVQNKTEQQKFLEKLLARSLNPNDIQKVADIACGGGG